MIKAIGVGRLGRDPELRTVKNQEVCNASVAVRTSKKNANGGYESEWYTLTAWGGRAQTLAKYCQKGTQLTFSGSLTHRSYKTKSGEDRVNYEIALDDFQIISSPAKAHDEAPAAAEDDDELPFD